MARLIRAVDYASLCASNSKGNENDSESILAGMWWVVVRRVLMGKAVGKKQISTVSVISYKLHPFFVHPL